MVLPSSSVSFISLVPFVPATNGLMAKVVVVVRFANVVAAVRFPPLKSRMSEFV